MGEVVNLRTHRKKAARREASAKADENRVRFGRSKAENDLIEARERQAETRLDLHRLEKPFLPTEPDV